MSSVELQFFDDRIAKHVKYVDMWRQPKEPLLFETLRAIDFVFCRELFPELPPLSGNDVQYHALQSWGVNHALERLVPDAFLSGPFKLFRSHKIIQSQADDFLFNCGILERAQLLRGWLSDGLLTARVQSLANSPMPETKHFLVLKSADPSLHAEMIAIAQREWLTRLSMEMDRAWEERLERRHMEVLPDLSRRVDIRDGWAITYTATYEIDRYFHEWGDLYLRRLWGSDLV